MEYKILIKLHLPEIEDIYEIYIPINKTVGQIISLLNHLVSDITQVYPTVQSARLYNRRTGTLYDHALRIIETDIRNGTELVMISTP